MSQAPDSLGALDPGEGVSGSTMAMTEGKPKDVEGAIESPPQFDRVADVLGPLERVVLAADQQIGTIQQRVSSEAGEMTAQAEKKIREASDDQRRRVAELRAELTDRVSELATRFDAMLTVLDEVDRALAVQGGWSNGSTTETGGDVKVTVTERHRVEIAHEAPPESGAASPESGEAPAPAKEKAGASPGKAEASPLAPPGAPPGAPPTSVPPSLDKPAEEKKEKKEKRKSFSFLRRSNKKSKKKSA